MSYIVKTNYHFKDLVDFSSRTLRQVLDLQYRSRLLAEREILKDLNLENIKVLDFGAGDQDFFSRYSNLQKYSVDPFASATWKSVQDIPSSEAFDLIVAVEVFEHIPNPEDILKSLANHQSQGKHLYLTTPFMAREHGAPEDYQRWTVTGLEALLKKSNYQVTKSIKRGNVISVTSAIWNYRLFKLLSSKAFLLGILIAPLVLLMLLLAHLTMKNSPEGTAEYLGISLLAKKI